MSNNEFVNINHDDYQTLLKKLERLEEQANRVENQLTADIVRLKAERDVYKNALMGIRAFAQMAFSYPTDFDDLQNVTLDALAKGKDISASENE